MNIVYVTWKFAEKENEVLQGGISNYLLKISKHMMYRGHNVTIVVSGKRKGKWKYEGVQIYSVQIPNLFLCEQIPCLKPVFREMAFNRALNTLNKEKKIDIVQYAGGLGAGMFHSRKYPSVLRASAYTRIESKGFVSDWDYGIFSFYEKIAGKRFISVFLPSKSWAVPFEKETGRKVFVINTPFELEEGIIEDYCIYNKYLKDKNYLLYFGRIHLRKGIGTIIRCIKDILSQHKDYLIAFAGPIELQQGGINLMHELAKAAGEFKDRIIYLGNLKHPQLYPAIRNAECILMPSLCDNFPNACLEALFLNGIVIGTKGASFDEIYSDGECGYLIEPDNDIQLVEKINMVISLPEKEKEHMRQKGKQVVKKYSFGKICKKLERYYQCVIDISNTNRHERKK